MTVLQHRGEAPTIDPSAYVAPTAVICGDVRIGPDARILFGAVLTAEDGSIEIGARCVVMENALVRGRAKHPARIGDDVLVGPHARRTGTRTSGRSSASSTFPAPSTASRAGRMRRR